MIHFPLTLSAISQQIFARQELLPGEHRTHQFNMKKMEVLLRFSFKNGYKSAAGKLSPHPAIHINKRWVWVGGKHIVPPRGAWCEILRVKMTKLNQGSDRMCKRDIWSTKKHVIKIIKFATIDFRFQYKKCKRDNLPIGGRKNCEYFYISSNYEPKYISRGFSS